MKYTTSPPPRSAAAAMIPKTRLQAETLSVQLENKTTYPVTRPAWKQALRDAITDPAELLQLLRLDPAEFPVPLKSLKGFPLRVPRSYAGNMQPGNPQDPLLLQVLPVLAEDAVTEGFSLDPVGDLASAAGPGLLHKYQGRALLITTGACAVHCRYCFRRAFPYAAHNARSGNWQDALAAIQADTSIQEIILSGGDPLSLTDDRLSWLAAQLDSIQHLKRLRIHTRQPIVLPERVDENLLAWLSTGRLQRIMVLHTNHPQELSPSVVSAIGKLRSTGMSLFNQSVLLRGVSDCVQTLAKLSQELFATGVVPYYLHQLDRVQGAAHFEVSDQEALRLYQELQNSLPGYMVPRLVREEPGQLSKRPL